MKLAKSLLLGTAAGLATVAGAQAADLPSRKAAPVEYVRVCSTYGAGFFYIPGTDTCIRIGGRARYEYQYSQPFSRDGNTTGSRATGRIYMDARTATEYGLLRAFVRYDVMRRVGAILSSTSTRVAYAFSGTGIDYGSVQTTVDLNRAFVQLGGLTAGRSQSYFDFYAGDLEYVGTTMASSMTTNLLAYTMSFGGGFSATLSIEDPNERRSVIVGTLYNGASVLTYDPKNPALSQGLPAGAIFGGNTAAVTGYGGNAVPDIVGVLRYEGGWGVAQLSGAVHQVRPVGGLAAANVVGSAVGYAPDSKYGFALNAGVKFNLPMLAPGDQLWLQGVYSKGAVSYAISNPAGWARNATATTSGLNTIAGYGVGATGRLMAVDAVVVNQSDVELTTVWGLTGAFLHYWTPTIRQAFLASYGKVDYSNAAAAAGFASVAAANGGPGLAYNTLRDWTYWTIGTNVTWSPVKDLDIGIEVNYLSTSASNGGVASNVTGDPTGNIYAKKTDSGINTRFRIVRDF